jgi:flagellar hook assembly protein FlgD
VSIRHFSVDGIAAFGSALVLTVATAVAMPTSASAADVLSPAITSIDPPAVNPAPATANVDIDYHIDVTSNAMLEVRDDTDQAVFGVVIGSRDEGDYTFSWNVRETDGTTVPPDGQYTVVLSTMSGGGDIGSDSAPLLLDSVAPTVASVRASGTAIYPVRDAYRDQATFTVRGIDPTASKGWVAIADASDRVVRKLGFGTQQTPQRVAWNGRMNNGRLAPAGQYKYRAVVVDSAGNEGGVTSFQPITVSHKRLVTKTFRTTVSARASLRVNDSGRCADLYGPGARRWKGSIGYYSWGHCRASGPGAVARGLHGVRVPAALTYVRASVSAYGGAAKARTRWSARIQFLNAQAGYRPLGTARVLRPSVGDHAVLHLGAAKLVDHTDRLLGWSVMTSGGSFYDVKSFTVALVYTVLR